MLKARGLLDRTDSKFVLPARELPALLGPLSRNYALLAAGDRRIARYESLYFDTAELRCFHDHRRGRRPRHKLRIRQYPDRRLCFLEIKTKQSDRRTIKHRLAKPYGDYTIGAREREFIAAHSDLPDDDIWPEVAIGFQRITLLGLASSERVTIDLGLDLARAERSERLTGVAIVEVKQWPLCVRTPVMQLLRGARVRDRSTSKYAAAVIRMHPGIRSNRFRAPMRALERMAAWISYSE